MDRTTDPCVDFFRYSCGGWNKKNPIPPDQARWDVYGKLTDDNAQFLWGLLEEAGRPAPGRDAATQKIGDYFASCMDEPAIEKAGASPLKGDLDAIGSSPRRRRWPRSSAACTSATTARECSSASAPSRTSRTRRR
jgi:endothelin-converting enzyme/putative endopeptidase